MSLTLKITRGTTPERKWSISSEAFQSVLDDLQARIAAAYEIPLGILLGYGPTGYGSTVGKPPVYVNVSPDGYSIAGLTALDTASPGYSIEGRFLQEKPK